MEIRKKRGLCILHAFVFRGYLYKKDGTGVRAYFMDECISEGAFLYSKIWDILLSLLTKQTEMKEQGFNQSQLYYLLCAYTYSPSK
jgi:hypothetical protein